MKRFLKEPLLHFLLLGALLFACYHLVSRRGRSTEPGQIVITQGQIEHLASGFTKVRQRAPTAEEMAALVRDRVREEVYCREAMALGLDKDDTIIRRRLRQKMEFLSDDIAAQVEPSDADLNAYLAAHADAFRVEQRVTFRHVYLNPDKHGDRLAKDAAEMLGKLSIPGGAVDDSVLGDSFLLERQFVAAQISEVGKQFGEKFAAKLATLKTGEWQGPIESGYGVHLVMVSDRTEGRLPALGEVREIVQREWDNARRLETNESFYQELLKRYTVTIEGATTPSAQK